MTRFWIGIAFDLLIVVALLYAAKHAKPMPNDSQSRALTGKE